MLMQVVMLALVDYVIMQLVGALHDYDFTCGLRPVFTLKSNVKVTGGSGTSASPYTLGV